MLETSVKGMVTNTDHMLATNRGVFRHRANGIELAPPICLLKYPVTKDETWETDTTIGNESVKVKVKAGDVEEITVPAGKYKAVRATIETTALGQQTSVTYWFAADVGVVKQSMVNDGKNITLELQEFEAGK